MSHTGVISYRQAAEHQDLAVGGLKVHVFRETCGIEKINVPEHTLFLVESDVTSTEIWNGVPQGQRDWVKGDLAFLPAGTDLSSPYVSREYDESIIRIKQSALIEAAEQYGDQCAPDLRFFMVPRADVFGIARSIVRLAEANRMHRAFPMLVEAMERSLHMALISSLIAISGKAIKLPGIVLSANRRRKALEFIEENLGRNITLQQIASAAAMSPDHFNRAFKATMGITTVRYVWARRVVLAKTLLRDKNMPIAEVAFSCGFATQSHFTTAFRMGTGTTPAEYRKAVI